MLNNHQTKSIMLRKKTVNVTKKQSTIALIEKRIQDTIRIKAYEIYLRDNCNDEIRNWLQAQKELAGN